MGLNHCLSVSYKEQFKKQLQLYHHNFFKNKAYWELNVSDFVPELQSIAQDFSIPNSRSTDYYYLKAQCLRLSYLNYNLWPVTSVYQWYIHNAEWTPWWTRCPVDTERAPCRLESGARPPLGTSGCSDCCHPHWGAGSVGGDRSRRPGGGGWLWWPWPENLWLVRWWIYRSVIRINTSIFMFLTSIRLNVIFHQFCSHVVKYWTLSKPCFCYVTEINRHIHDLKISYS